MSGDNILETNNNLETQYIQLQDELRRIQRKPQGQIAYFFMGLGIIFLGFSIVHNHTILAMIGIALTFWGALLRYVRPTSFVRKEVLDVSVTDYFYNIKNLIERMELNGTPKYVTPGALQRIRKVILYLPKSDSDKLPSDDILTDERFILDNPPALKLIPPGYELFLLLEKELRINFSYVDLEYIKKNLKKAIVDGLEIAKTVELEQKGSIVEVTIVEPIFDKVLTRLLQMDSYPFIGDPLTSSIACIISSSTHQPTVIKSVDIDSEKNTVRIGYELME